MITITQKGDFKKTSTFLHRITGTGIYKGLDKYGEMGVDVLSENTPKDSGKTAASWYYRIQYDLNKITISWYNSNLHENVPIAIILQYGHGTGTGGYVKGVDYINPALRPIFESIADAVWEEVSKS